MKKRFRTDSEGATKVEIVGLIITVIGVIAVFVGFPALHFLFMTNNDLNFKLGGLQFIVALAGSVCIITGISMFVIDRRKRKKAVYPVIVRLVMATILILVFEQSLSFQTVRALPMMILIASPFIGVFLFSFPAAREKLRFSVPAMALFVALALTPTIIIAQQNAEFYRGVEARFGNPPNPVTTANASPPDEIVTVVYDTNNNQYVYSFDPPSLNASDVTVIILRSTTVRTLGVWVWVDSEGNPVSLDRTVTNTTTHDRYVNVETGGIYKTIDD